MKILCKLSLYLVVACLYVRSAMNEYDVSFYATEDGAIAVDIHASSGTAPYLKFPSKIDVCRFFESIGMTRDKLRQVESICSKLQAHHGFHEKMFLPRDVNEAVCQKAKLSADN